MATNNSINIPETIQVTHGGTGLTTITAHSVLVGEGTSAITPLTVGTNGQVLIGATGADPAFATLTSTGGSITYTTGANSLNLDLISWVGKTSFTPTLTFGGGSTGLTYTTQKGLYCRISNFVWFMVNIQINAIGSSTGAALINSLPVTSGSIPCAVSFVNTATFTGTVGAYVNSSATTVQLVQISTGGSISNLTNSNFAGGDIIYLCGWYKV